MIFYIMLELHINSNWNIYDFLHYSNQNIYHDFHVLVLHVNLNWNSYHDFHIRLILYEF